MKKCCKCKDMLPDGAFHRSKARHDGLQGICKRCESEYRKTHRSFAPKENPQRLKRCSVCETRKPATLEHFSPVRDNWDGMSYACRVCQNQRAKDWNHAHPDKVVRRKKDFKVRQILRQAGITEKICLRCGQPKDLLEFERHGKVLRNVCKFCRDMDAKQLRQTPMGKYKDYKKGAIQRGLGFELTFPQFMEFWQKPCVYCGKDIATIGIDRIDSASGYHVGNCLPCHHRCNTMKGDQHPIAWIAQMRLILEHLGLTVEGDIHPEVLAVLTRIDVGTTPEPQQQTTTEKSYPMSPDGCPGNLDTAEPARGCGSYIGGKVS